MGWRKQYRKIKAKVAICREFVEYEPDENCYGIIYMAINMVDGMVYIGQTTMNLKKRKIGHFSSSRNGRNSNLYEAMRMTTEDTFEWGVVTECYSKEELDKEEKKFVALFRRVFGKENVYNMTAGGQGGHGKEDTPEQLENRRRAAAESWTEERRKKQTERMKGNKFGVGYVPSEEHRQAISEAHTGRQKSPETIEKYKANRWTPEKKKEHSDNMKGNQYGLGNPTVVKEAQEKDML